MSGSMLSAHTRLVPALRRADTRAKTEPRRVARPAAEPTAEPETVEYPRTFEAADAGRESLPYLELEIATEPQTSLPAHLDEGTTAKRPKLRIVKTVSRKIGIGTGPEAALPADDDDQPTSTVPKQPTVTSEEELELSTERVAKVIESLTQPDTPKLLAEVKPSEAKPLAEAKTEANAEATPPTSRLASDTEPNGPAPRPSRLQWLGVVLTQPELGAALMIGTWLRPEFCVTSPVTQVVRRGDGKLVQTLTKSLYFVGPAGDTYLVRKVD
jgi:hypothetical protein